MPYKAVCEELWSIIGDALTRFLYRETEGEAAVSRLERALTKARETRRMRENNNNSHPRSAAREHTGPRTHVPDSVSLSVDRLFPFVERRRSLTDELEGAPQ